MTITANIVPFEQVFGLDGKPLDNGKIYIGTPNQDPQYNQVQVYWDEAGTITASQPIRTVAGYISYNGAPARIYVNGNYSLKVLTKNDQQVYYVPDYLMTGNQDALTPITGLAQFATYAALRLYNGAATAVYVAGRTNDQDGAAGNFAVDEADTTSADNDGTILIDAIGRRWKRQGEIITPQMFGAKGDGINDDTLPIKNALATIKKEVYAKGGGKLTIPIPSGFYKITDTIDLTEIWNLTIEGENQYNYQRQPAAVDPNLDYATFHWYGATDKSMIRADFTFGLVLRNLSFNGRDLAKIGVDIAPATSVASTTRQVEMDNVSVKWCDFGVRIGDLAAQTDNGSVDCYNLTVNYCKSAAVLVNSGNAYCNLYSPVFSFNGYAPTTGNSFITNANNVGAQLNILAGYVTITGLTADHDGATYAVNTSTISQAGGSLKINGAWDDSPTKPFYKGNASRSVYFNGVTHYDSGMTPAGTPHSIQYNGSQPLVLESCYLYGNVEITSGNQASVIDLGTRFVRSDAGFTGDMVTQYGGLIRMGRSEVNSLNASFGGDFPKELLNKRAPLTVWNNGNNTGLVRGTIGGKLITECYIDGALNILSNAYFNADTGQFIAIKAGACWRVAYSSTAQSFESFTASSDYQTITWGSKNSFINVGSPNGYQALQLGRKLMFDSAAPTVGSWERGDKVMRTDPSAGGTEGWVCVASGTPGTWKTFGSIAA